MVKPVTLVETCQTFERAYIEEWLDANNTCPASGRQLTRTPELIINYSLQQSIEDWAQMYGLQLPPAPVYRRPFDLDTHRDQGSNVASSSHRWDQGGIRHASSSSGTPYPGPSHSQHQPRLGIGGMLQSMAPEDIQTEGGEGMEVGNEASGEWADEGKVEGHIRDAE